MNQVLKRRNISFVIGTVTALLLTFPIALRAMHVVYQVAGHSPGTSFSSPMGIFFDSQRDECYVADTGNHRVVIHDRDGIPVYRFVHMVERAGKRVKGEPKSIVVDDEGRIFLTDNLVTYIDVLDFRGNRIQQIYPPEDECPEPHRFQYLALANNTVYATLDCPRRRVATIDGTLAVARTITLGNIGEERLCLSAIAVDAEGQIYIGDPCASQMIHVYDADGAFVTGFGGHDHGFENFSFPGAITVLPSGDMWIVDTIRQVVSRFRPNGDFVSHVGGKGDGPGAFNYPSGVASDGKSRLFVLERGGNRYQCFEFESGEQVGLTSTEMKGGESN